MAVELSIGAAVYNIDEGFLRAFIEGAVRQLTDETELLLIDDCSTNNSGEICREYAASDSRVRYINMGQNGGLSRVRNRTIEEAAGKWIFFADGDDLLSDHFVETALRFCGADFDIILHERLKFAEQKDEEQPCAVSELTELPAEAGRAFSISCLCLDPSQSAQFGLSNRVFYHAAWGAIYRKEFLVKNDLLFPAGQKKAQDSVFNTWVYSRAEKIAYLPYVMYFYRNNAQGITRRYSGDFPAMAVSLIGHLRKCIDTLFPGDADVEARFRDHRVMSLVMDEMRLNIFHKGNPNPRQARKQAFLEFIDTEPYKSAIRDFDPKTSDRWEWHLPVVLIRKKNFALLDLFIGNDTAFRILCGADKRLQKTLR
ncbi:MAG: glycosyltransferase [Clostridia bacterium]|nr:glycosyltransferase [Clostridia bacterium]